MSTENEPKKKKKIKWLLIIRRTHLYTGVFLFPFIILIGVSGFLFNHNSTFWGGPLQSVSAPSSSSVKEITGFQGIKASDAAAEVLKELNKGEQKYTLEDPSFSHFTRPLSIQSGDLRVQLDLEDASVSASKNVRPEHKVSKAPFDGVKSKKPLIQTKEIADSFNRLFPDRKEEFEVSSFRGSELRFNVKDESGKVWNVRYDYIKNQFSGNASDDPAPFNLSGFLTKLHKTHHYPHQVNSKWVWVLMADLSALAIVVWGITGLVLAWQLKNLRKLCIGLLIVSLITAVIISMANLADMKLTPPRTRSALPQQNFQHINDFSKHQIINPERRV